VRIYSQDTILIDFERYLDLGSSAGSGRDSSKVEHAKLVVILYESALTFEYCDVHLGLLVSVSCESLGLLGRNDRAALDNG